MNDATPADVLRFWFDEAGPDAWWKPSEAFDAEVRARFGSVHEAAGRGEYDDWLQTPEGALALVIVLDQFPRNMYRATQRAYETDAKALAVAGNAVDRGFDDQLSEAQRHFLYMPFMHSEVLADQDRCVELMRAGLPSDHQGLKYAEHHRDIVRRFGRFPHRNRILGRESRPEEEQFLAEGGFGG